MRIQTLEPVEELTIIHEFKSFLVYRLNFTIYFGLYLVLMRPLGSQVVNLKTSVDLFLSFPFDYLFLYHSNVIDLRNGLT